MQLSPPAIVEAWTTYRTGNATQWTARQLAQAKRGDRVSVVIPARNEQETVGAIVGAIRRHLIQEVALVAGPLRSRRAAH